MTNTKLDLVKSGNEGNKDSKEKAEPIVIKTMNLASFSGVPVPARQWIIEDMMPARVITSLYGEGGTGKSLLALQIGVCLASGAPLFGIPIRKHRVLGVFCEDEMDEIHRRIEDIRLGMCLSYENLCLFDVTSWVDLNPILMDFNYGKGAITATFEALEQKIQLLRPNVLILDTVADLFGGNENVRTEVRQFLSGSLRQLAVKYNLGILLLAHPSVAGIQTKSGMSGSTAWSNSVRSRLFLDRPNEEGRNENVRILSIKKANYSATGMEIRMRYENGLFVKDGATVRDATDKKELAEARFMTLLDEHCAQGRKLSASRNAASYAPKVFSKHERSNGIKYQEFEKAMESLFDKEMILNEAHGKTNKLSRRLDAQRRDSVGK